MSSAVAVPFQYPRLKDPASQFRLLSIQPDCENARLSAKLQVHKISAAPPYIALSYTWGDPLPTKPAMVGSQPIRLRYNCWHALWQARTHYPNTLVWIDGLCIDQRNLSEKSVQVRMMGSIFANADHVAACLGAHTDDSAFACQAIEMLEVTHSAHLSIEAKKPSSTPKPQSYPYLDEKCQELRRQWKKCIENFEPLDRLGRAMDNIGSRKFWERLWIVQEIKLAKRITILCGEYRLNWESYFVLLGVIQQYWTSPDRRQLSALTVFELRHRASREPSQLLPILKSFKCSDPRDLIFGSLQVVAWPRPVTVDYRLTRLGLAAAVIAVREETSTTWWEDTKWVKVILDLLDIKPSDRDVVSGNSFEAIKIHNLLSTIQRYEELEKRWLEDSSSPAYNIGRDYSSTSSSMMVELEPKGELLRLDAGHNQTRFAPSNLSEASKSTRKIGRYAQMPLQRRQQRSKSKRIH